MALEPTDFSVLTKDPGTRGFLKTFGTVQIFDAGQPVALRNAKARALLAYLALNGADTVSRLQLSDLLWSDTDEAHARSSLRQSLAAIRRALGSLADDMLQVDGERIGLNRKGFTTDLDLLLAQIGLGSDPAALTDACLAVPRILDDVRSVSPAFEDWATVFRIDAQERVQTQLKSIYTDEAQTSSQRMQLAQIALKLDSYDEEAIRVVMRLLFENGEASAALRQYGIFSQRLKDDLDTPPSEVTQDLASAIKMNALPSVAATSSRVIEPNRPKPDLTPQLMPAGAGLAAAHPAVPPVTLAVMPFEVMGQGSDARMLSLGLLDHLTCHLASFRAPSVISSNTTRIYLEQAPRPALVGRELNARYLLSGSIWLSDRNASLAVQLVEAQSERVVWGSTLTSSPDEILQLNFPIAQEIARAIMPSVNAEELRFSRSLPDHKLEPYHLILQAKEMIFELDQAKFSDAGSLLRRAIGLEPQFAPAHSVMADWLSISLWEGWSKDQIADRAALDHHARKAIALSPGDGRVMALWAHNRMMFDRDYDVALALLKDAVALTPNDAEALAWSVPTLSTTGNADQAVKHAHKAIELSPYDPFLFRNEHFLSFALYSTGDFDKAAEYGLSSFRRAPNYSGNLRATIAALVAAGRKSEALTLVEHHQGLIPGFSVEEFKTRQGYRDPKDRDTFARFLIEAGLPQ